MLIWIIRHGKAEQDSPSGLDADRALRSRGTRQAQWLAEQLRSRSDAPRRVLSSPAIRARQTAQIVCDVLDLEIGFDARLRVDEPVGPVIDLLADLGRDDPELRIALFGHNPQLSILARAFGAGDLALRTGEAALMDLPGEMEPGAGALVALLRLEE